MQRFIELAKLWPYLPHFRIVAEYESLSRASRRVGLTSAALSKAIRTLERGLDVELFERSGGKLRINDRGRALLGSVRAAMRDLDDAIAATRGARVPGTLRVAVDGAWASFVVPVRGAEEVELVEMPANTIHALLRGDVDVVLHADVVSHTDLESVPFATFPRAVCVAAASRDAAPAELAFVAVKPHDGWPAHVARRIGLTASSLAQALAAAAGSQLAIVAPVELARGFGLRTVEAEVSIAPLVLWVTTRRPRRGEPSAAVRWRDAVRTQCARRLGA